MENSPHGLAAQGGTCRPGYPLFSLGRLATPKALALLQEAGEDAVDYIARHVCGDWQQMPAADQEQNQLAAQGDARVFSSYRLNNGQRIWIITEADRSCTTILSPDEY